MLDSPKCRRLLLPGVSSLLGLGYFVAVSQVPLFWTLKVPLAMVPLQIVALGYVGFYWRRRSRRQRHLDSEHFL